VLLLSGVLDLAPSSSSLFRHRARSEEPKPHNMNSNTHTVHGRCRFGIDHGPPLLGVNMAFLAAFINLWAMFVTKEVARQHDEEDDTRYVSKSGADIYLYTACLLT
jgi:hypothetical protein